MFNNILLFSVLILFNSCFGSTKTVSHSNVETKKNEIIKTETIVSSEPKTIELAEEIIPTAETSEILEYRNEEQDPVSTEIAEEKTEKLVDTIKAFNHTLWNDLLQKYISANGNVDYKGFKSDHSTLKNYIATLSENTPTKTWTKEDKLAYWMNAYNALTVDLIVRHYPLKSIKDIDKPWGQRLWKLGNKWYNLEEIEHQILRKMNEPRIHFGIVCASVSCPKLQNKAFTSSNLETQLTNATKGFLADPARNNLSQNSIKISKIFKWFSSDFKENGSLVDFINKYSEIVISQNASKSYKDYDWNLNE
ncbi:MAG: DUF547 domain-containing protein [Flavobacteriaceae bacterium]|nr:DUF547 domain-containing protein [Flavobacteriaceae bacterium]